MAWSSARVKRCVNWKQIPQTSSDRDDAMPILGHASSDHGGDHRRASPSSHFQTTTTRDTRPPQARSTWHGEGASDPFWPQRGGWHGGMAAWWEHVPSSTVAPAPVYARERQSPRGVQAIETLARPAPSGIVEPSPTRAEYNWESTLHVHRKVSGTSTFTTNSRHTGVVGRKARHFYISFSMRIVSACVVWWHYFRVGAHFFLLHERPVQDEPGLHFAILLPRSLHERPVQDEPGLHFAILLPRSSR